MAVKLAVGFEVDGERAAAAGVVFDDWGAREPERSVATRLDGLPKPPRGEPDLRAVTAVLHLLRDHALQPDVIVLDGPVHLDADDKAGVGRHLHDALGGRVAVIGVAKSARPPLPAQFEVHREEEAPPVLVTCAGIDLGAAKARVRTMHGRKRVPTLLKLAARLAAAELNPPPA